jgi:hypothetical protein
MRQPGFLVACGSAVLAADVPARWRLRCAWPRLSSVWPDDSRVVRRAEGCAPAADSAPAPAPQLEGVEA